MFAVIDAKAVALAGLGADGAGKVTVILALQGVESPFHILRRARLEDDLERPGFWRPNAKAHFAGGNGLRADWITPLPLHRHGDRACSSGLLVLELGYFSFH